MQEIRDLGGHPMCLEYLEASHTFGDAFEWTEENFNRARPSGRFWLALNHPSTKAFMRDWEATVDIRHARVKLERRASVLDLFDESREAATREALPGTDESRAAFLERVRCSS